MSGGNCSSACRTANDIAFAGTLTFGALLLVLLVVLVVLWAGKR